MKSVFKNDLTKHTTIANSIIKNIRESILRSQLHSGSSLKQDLLAQQYGVSISVLREALKALEGEGFIEFIPNKGAYVKQLAAQEALDIFDVRLLLETEALARSLPLLTENDFFLLEGLLDEEEFCFDPVRYNDLNLQFHTNLYKHCGNAKLLDSIYQLHNQVSRYMTVYLRDMSQKEVSQKEHRALLDACRKQDKRAAKAILKKHTQNAGKALATYLADNPDV